MTGTVVATNGTPTSRANNGCLIERAAAFCSRLDDFDAIRTPHRAQVVFVQDVTRGGAPIPDRQRCNFALAPTS